MEEIIINEEVLEDVAGGAGSSRQHVQIVNCKNRVNVRSTPDATTDDNKIGYAYLNDRYVFYSWSGNWAKIQYGSRKAYVYRDFVKIVD